MKYFSIPSDFRTETIDKLYVLNNRYDNNKVIETYGQITVGGILNSGRITEVLPVVDIYKLKNYIEYSNSKGIKFNYTLNPACFGNYEFSEAGIEEINELLKDIYDIGVRDLTLTSPALIEIVKASNLPFNIKASAICEITSPTKAYFYKNLGVKRVVVDPDITRDFEKLKNICNTFGDGVEIIINNVCYKNCAYKMFHYNHEAHCTNNSTQSIKDYYFNRCSMQKAEKIVNLIKLNWIRPEDVKFYDMVGIKYFKIQGRQNVLQGDIIKTLEYYFDGDYNGNLFDLITIFAPYNSYQQFIDNKKLEGFLETFFNNPHFCKDNCTKCNYCEKYSELSMNIEESDRMSEKALKFFREYDRFTKVIRRKSEKVNTNRDASDYSEEIEFDFE